MRAILSKVAAVSMIAGAGLVVAACGGSTPATVNNTVDPAPIENIGAADDMTGGIDAANATENGSVITTTNSMDMSTSNAM
ncbi:MAG: hypothetical protein ABW182_03100 [Sphingomonas sp.]